MKQLNLNNKIDAYFYGLLLADGTLYTTTRNRGKISIELNDKDSYILKRMHTYFKIKTPLRYRTRKTNFKQINTVILSIYDLQFRNKLQSYNYPIGKKSKYDYIIPPHINKHAFLRGLYDGDGSLGFTSKNEPYISICIYNETLKNFIITILNDINIHKNVNRNQRDDVYNIILKNEDAVTLINYLNYQNEISIPRKKKNAIKISKWVRPVNKKRTNRKSWNKTEDLIILNNNIEYAMKVLNRSKSSIKNRLYRLKHHN